MTEDSRTRLDAALRVRRERVNDAIDEQLPVQRPERLYEASRYLLEAGGKRLRPTILLLTAEAVTDTEPMATDYRAFPDVDDAAVDVLSAAVSIEVIQSFTLIHDDIMDELATTCTNICEGQAFDVEFESRGDVAVDEYLEMVELKTAVLYAAAASIPAILLGADDETVESLRRYGLSIGQAFQIQDDLLDLTTPSDELGKTRGSDLVENKQTLITLHARGQGVDVDSLVDVDDPDAVDEATIEAAVEELEAAGSIDYAREAALDLVDQGKTELEVLPDGEARALLEEIADYLVERTY